MALISPPLRPNADDVTLGGMTYSTGAAGWSLIDDAPSNDATYVTSASTGSGIYFGLTTFTLGGTQRAKRVRMRARYFHNSADTGHSDYCDFRLRDPNNGKNSVVWPGGTNSNSAVEDSSGWYTADPNGAAWGQNLINRLQVSTAWRITHGDGSLTQLRLTELYVDVDVFTQPVVSAVTVTGPTTGTRPAFSWTYTQAESQPQTRRQIKVFSSTQYGAAGFDPATSTPVWNSGVLSGAATSGTVGVDLLNGITYRVYVKTAMSWTGPAGTLWWSDWVASSAFAINLTPPPAPTITVTAEPTLPGYRNRVLVSLGGLNVLDADTAGIEASIGDWVAGANTNTPTLSATNPKSGTNDLLLTATGIGTIEALSGTFATSTRVDPGAVVSATASLRALVTTANWQVGIRFYDVAGATISTTMGSAVSVTSGGYTTPVLLNQTAPANAYSANVRVLSASVAASTQYRLDEAGLIVGATAPWSPGGSLQTGTLALERSQRISPTIGRGPARNWVHPQVYSAGALTTSTDGFYARQANDSVLQWSLDRAAPESPANSTAGMIEWVIRVGASSFLDIGAPDGVATDGMHPYMFPAVPGLNFTGSTWLWASSAITVRLALIYVDAFNGTPLGTTLTSNTVLSTTPQKVSVAATAPAGTVYARLAVEDTNATTGISVFTTQPKFRPTAEPDEAWPGQVFAFAWENVRGSGQALPQTGETTMSFYDHEAPPGRPVMYRATINALTATGDVISSTPSVPVHAYMDEPARTLVKDPFQPENAAIVNVWPGDNVQSTEDVTELHAMGRDDDPVFLRSWRGGAWSGELSALSELEWYRLQQLLPSSRPLLIQWPEGGQSYVRVQSWSAERTRPGFYKTIAVSGSKTARPV